MSKAGKRTRSARRTRSVLIGAVVAMTTLALLPAAAAAGYSGTGSDCTSSRAAARGTSPLDGVCEYLDGRQGVVQVALFDKKAGRLYSLRNGDDKQYTASIVKVDILSRWLRMYQRRGVEIPDDIPFSIKFLMHHMIENSDNSAATALFHFGGGCDALNSFNARFPLPETDVACESDSYYGWGNTTTSAADQVRIMKMLAYGMPARILGLDGRTFALKLMQSVEPDQRFGVTCGPWGTVCDPPNWAPPDPDVTVALKNGWKTLPTCPPPIDNCPWQVNSNGFVQGKGRNYVLSVLTTKDPPGGGGTDGFTYGINTIQGVSKLIWANLG